jgi:hypothetical protein
VRSPTSTLTTTLGGGDEPPTRYRPLNTELRGDRQVPSALDGIPEPMVIVSLPAAGGRHPDRRSLRDTDRRLRA